MSMSKSRDESVAILEADVKRLEMELEFARERLRRRIEEITLEEREADVRAAQPTVRVRRRAVTLPAFTVPGANDFVPRPSPAARRGATMALGAMPLPTPSWDEPSGARMADSRHPKDAGRYEYVHELTRKRSKCG